MIETLCPQPTPLIGPFAPVGGGSPTPGPGPTPTPTVDWTGVGAPIDTTLYASTFFKDRGGSSLVTATLDDVACIRHPVTGAIVWQMPASAAVPWQLVITGGVPYLRPKDITQSLLEFAFGAASAFFNFGFRLKSSTASDNSRLLGPIAAGGNAYVSQKASGRFELWNVGGDVMLTAADFGAGAGGTFDGYISGENTLDASKAPQKWARLRTGTTDSALSGSGFPPDSSSPGAGTIGGIGLGAPDAGFGGPAADVLIRAGYFHQASTLAGLLPLTKVNEINTWMSSLAL